MNYKTIFNIIGKVLLLEAALMLLPLGVSVIYSDGCTDDLLIGAAAAAALGAVMFLPTRKAGKPLSVRDSLAVAALTWLFASLAGCLPFLISGEISSFPDAFFETVSGFTTTGASILTDVERMSRSLQFWRSFTHWLGGMGILVLVTAIAAGSGDGSTNILKAEMPGHSLDKFTPKAKNNAKLLYDIYIVLTLLETVLLIAGGMPVFDSVVHALGTAGTGGFGVRNDSIASYSPYIQWVVTIFMILFGVNFNVYFFIYIRKLRDAARCEEMRWYLGIIAAATVLICANAYDTALTLEHNVRNSAFQVASIITTTGFATVNFDLWPELSRTILVMLMFCGACAGSTGGGLKVSRFVIAAKSLGNYISTFLHPRAVRKVKFEDKDVEPETLRAILVYFIAVVFIFAVSVLLVSLDNFDQITNFTAVAATFNNIGPGLNAVGPTCNFAGFSAFAKCVMIFDMLAGRLEIFPLLMLLYPPLWRESVSEARRRKARAAR